MTDVAHEHSGHTHSSESGSGLGFMLGILALIVFMYLLFVYGLPALRGATTSPQINVPDQIDINVNNPQGGQ